MGFSVSLAPFKHPVQAGIEAFSLAALSIGFVYGVGIGDARLRRALGAPSLAAPEYARAYVTVARGAARGVHDPRPPFGGFDVAPLRPSTAGPGLIGLGALRPPMARVAGEVADACLTWLAPARYLAQVTVPAIAAGAAAAGREPPPVVALLPYVGDMAREPALAAARRLLAAHLASRVYRCIPTALGGKTWSDEILDEIVLRGSAAELEQSLQRLSKAGAAEVAFALYAGMPAADRAALVSIIQKLCPQATE